MFVVGGGVMLAAASVNTILQTIVPDRAARPRRRDSSCWRFSAWRRSAISPPARWAASIGVPATFAVNGGLAAVAALWFWRALPKWRALMRPTYRRLGIISGES